MCRWAAEEIFLSLTDTAFELEVNSGGLGFVWQSRGGCGFMTMFNVGRVSTEDLCNAGNLGNVNIEWKITLKHLT